MLKIVVTERPYFGHGTIAQHFYDISEGLSKITYDKYEHKLVVEFDSCSNKMELRVDELINIKIES